jgi:hypothetical protein
MEQTKKYKCGKCKGYRANFCNTYDEVTKEDSEVRCIGFDPTATCGECCYASENEELGSECVWCEFHDVKMNKNSVACDAWEPKIEL